MRSKRQAGTFDFIAENLLRIKEALHLWVRCLGSDLNRGVKGVSSELGKCVLENFLSASLAVFYQRITLEDLYSQLLGVHRGGGAL